MRYNEGKAPIAAPIDLLYFCMEDWHAMRQRSRHLAEGLARLPGRPFRVIYVNPCYYSAAGFLRDRLRGGSIRQQVWGVERVSESLSVVSLPPLLPKGGMIPAIGHANYALLLPFMRRTFRQLGVHQPVLWLTTPPAQFLIGKLDERFVIYDCMDRHAYFFEGIIRRLVACEEQRLLRRTDAVIASSQALEAACRAINPNVYRVANGVDLDSLLNRSLLNPLPGDPLPEAPRPIFGYMGTLGGWLDLDLLAQVCAAYPHATVVLLGPVKTDLSALASIPNLRIVGARPYAEMGRYLAAFDVCLIPFQINELTRAVNPLKLYEYFAFGKPVVSTALPELEPYRDLAVVAATPADFIDGIARALTEPPSLAAARRQAAAANTWQMRAAQVRAVIHQQQEERSPCAS